MLPWKLDTSGMKGRGMANDAFLFTMDEDSMSARARAGRVCRFASCGTVLSRYNPDHLCAVHMRATAFMKSRELSLVGGSKGARVTRR
jgi:hypothetical protein